MEREIKVFLRWHFKCKIRSKTKKFKEISLKNNIKFQHIQDRDCYQNKYWTKFVISKCLKLYKVKMIKNSKEFYRIFQKYH